MPTYKLPPGFHPSRVEDLRVAYVEAITQWHLTRDQPARIWITVANTVKEALYVRGMDHQIVDALVEEWHRAARRNAEQIKKDVPAQEPA
jgi:hypothetical protein